MTKKINQLCIASLFLIAVELIYSLILKSKAVPSPVVVGNEGTQSLVYFFPAVAGTVFCILMIITAVMVTGTFKSFAKNSIPKKFAFAGAWLLNVIVSVQSVIKTSTMEMFSFENNILRIVLFISVIFSLLSCFIVRRIKIS